MLHVVQPLALVALGTLAIPIVIHLRRRPLPVVRVGSLRPFLAHPRSHRARALLDLPLLLLRCALLASLALSLAGPHWTPRSPSPARWCLLLPGTRLHETHLREWTLRLREGFEARWLAPGFPRIVDPFDSPATDPQSSVWSLLREADMRLSAGSEAWVFGPTWSPLFEGSRPSVTNLHVHWHQVPTPPPTSTPPPAHSVGIVFSPDRAVDAGYVRAALTSLGAEIVTNEVPSWIFHLGPAPLPWSWDELESHSAHIVRDARDGSEPAKVSRRIETGSMSVPLRQRIAPGPGTPMFRDSHGEPWLTKERQGTVVVWHVAFRFHADWTDWPLESAFPAWWRERLQPLPFSTTSIAPEQATPRFVPNPVGAISSAVQRPASIDLRAEAWLLGLVLFLVERRVSMSPTRRRDPTPIASGAT